MITTVKKLLTNLSHLAKDKKAWLALVAGLFLTLSYAPYNLWFITFLSLGALLYCINPLANGKLAAKQSAKYGFIFGLGWFGAGISWVHVSIATFGGMPLIASMSLMVLLCAYLALYPALAAWLATRLANGPYSFICWLLATVAITEYLRGTLLTGFPWLSLGYALIDAPVTALAPIGGVYFMGALMMVGAGEHRGTPLAEMTSPTQRVWLRRLIETFDDVPEAVLEAVARMATPRDQWEAFGPWLYQPPAATRGEPDPPLVLTVGKYRNETIESVGETVAGAMYLRRMLSMEYSADDDTALPHFSEAMNAFEALAAPEHEYVQWGGLLATAHDGSIVVAMGKHAGEEPACLPPTYVRRMLGWDGATADAIAILEPHASSAEDWARWSHYLYSDDGVIRMGIGKYAGQPLAEVDAGYLRFMLSKWDDMPEAVKAEVEGVNEL